MRALEPLSDMAVAGALFSWNNANQQGLGKGRRI